ncbi:antitoxin VbhA family protein [Cupriavidus basilensis]|uniref:antitoxin VbhA family protein n=1 Tax=Cupriavidus basilensis TaxID=68895 RepID=UPI002840526C|nr:antitoxin VbhA family protein [Cupriavidus basilensis]MDR3383934.1 antitoxin VbhA family protein [Cupriavidus basilensis]
MTNHEAERSLSETQTLASCIDEPERARRKAAIDYARGSVRFEGFVLSPEVEEINRRFIDGELTGDEHVAAIAATVLRGSA